MTGRAVSPKHSNWGAIYILSPFPQKVGPLFFSVISQYKFILRLRKLNHLHELSRFIVLRKAQALRDNEACSLKSFEEEPERVKELKLAFLVQK